VTFRGNRDDGDQRTAHPTFNDHDAAAGGRWRLRNWRLRSKLLAVLLIPVLTVLGLLGVRVYTDAGNAVAFRATTARLDVTTELHDLAGALRDERDLSVRFAAGGRDDGLEAVRAARAGVDTAMGEFERALRRARSELSDRAAQKFDGVVRDLQGLSELRFQVGHGDTTVTELGEDYTRLVRALRRVDTGAVTKAEDSELSRAELAVAALDTLAEQYSTTRRILSAALAAGELSEQRAHALREVKGKAEAAYEEFRTFATSAQRQRYATTVSGSDVEQRNEMRADVLGGSPAESLSGDITAARWHEAASGALASLTKLRDELHSQVADRAGTLRNAARTALLIDLGLLVGVLLVAGVLAVLVARSLLRQMRALRRSALDVAEERLPAAVHGILTDSEVWPDPRQWQRHLEPVPVSGRDELGQVARAFDAVHGEAVRLAGEQAMLRENINSMFVNLSRRSQELVERQLTVLDRMEEHEQDSETLGGLFELDHLATRMRRNSENLLVLSGQDLDYPMEGSVSAEEVVGAALSEVEHYQRVRVQASPEPSVAAEVAGDLVHVLSELLENATSYSPDDSEVSLCGRLDDDGSWVIEITDWGAGMPEVELQRVNRRLAEPPDVDVEVSRRMGLYVVARLSARHGVNVRLDSAATGGLVARVVVPAELVTVIVPEEPSIVPEEPSTPAGQESTLQLSPVLPTGLRWPISAPEETAVDDGQRRPQQHPVEPSENVSEGTEPVWPTEDRDAAPLHSELLTERLPAYRDVLAEWFRPSEDGKLGDLRLVRAGEGPDSEWIAEWPESTDAVWIEPGRVVAGGGSRNEALPKRIPHPDRVPAAGDTPAMDETEYAANDSASDADAPTLEEHMGLTM